MPITFIVPGPIQQAAERGLEAHADPEWKLKGVAGASVADSLASGHVTIETVAKMHRFFAVNAKPYLHEVQQLRTLQDSPMIRSWHLHGAAAGHAWADRLFKESVEKGLIPADPVSELMSLRPDGVYNRFALGSWRFEYDLDPAKAARFVENYMRATGWSLDLRQAFGRSAEAVGNAIYRRFHTPDPFRQAFRALMAEDVEYRIAAQRDLEFMRRNTPPNDRLVLETFTKHTFTYMNPKQAAKLVWAPFVAYFILATEAPDILKPLNDTSVKPPNEVQKPKTWKVYHDTINTYVAYFHPLGLRFVDPAEDEKFASITNDMAWTMWEAYYGKKLHPAQVQKLLGKVRRWMAKNKLAGNLFHLFIADWKKANWQHILDNIPLDADVRPYFEKFVGTNPLPKEGVKLQQTLSKKSEKKSIFSYSNAKGWGEPEAVSVKKSGAYFAAQKKNTPLGVYSLVTFEGIDYVYLGAWKSKGQALQHFFRNSKTGSTTHSMDAVFSGALESGKAVVKQGHKDMPGTAYKNVNVAPEKVQEPPDEIAGQIQQLLADDFPDHYQEFMAINLSDTNSSDAAFVRFGGSIVPGVSLTDKTGAKFIFLEAYQTPKGIILILRNPDGELIWQVDDEFASIVATSNIKMKGLKDPEVLNKAGQQADPDMPGVPTEAGHPALTNMFNPGDIIDLGEPSYYLVLAFEGDMYLLLRLHATSLGSVATALPAAGVESTGTVIGTHVGGVITGESYVHVPATANPLDLPPEFKPGSVVLVGDEELTLIKAFDLPKLGKAVLAFESKTTYWQGNNIAYPNYLLATFESFEAPVESSYAPTEPRPEPGAEDAMDEHDPETGKAYMCGTPAALAYIAKKGWQPATKPENTTLDFDLGAKVAYGPSKTRTIIGYAFMPEKGAPVYITMTEKGNVSFKTTTAGNKAYGPVIEVLQEIIDTLVPKPGEAKPEFPKLNYALSNTAKKIAKEAGLIYIPAPDKAPFYVGTKLRYLHTKDKLRLLGWVSQTKGGEATGVPEAILYDSAEEVMWPATEIADLKKNYTIAYQHGTAVDWITGEMTFGKVPTDTALAVSTPYGVSIGATPLPDGWDDPDPIEQTPMPQLPKGSHVSAGIVAVIPPGAMLSDAQEFQATSSTLFLLTHPMNDFAGYTLTYPKGTVDSGESLEHTAVREVYEETGLSVKPVALLGDFKGRDSITRFFIGYITGGSPTDAGKETDAVTFKPVPPDYHDMPWYGELKSRDKMVTDAAVKWILDKGWPNLFTGEKADTYSQVTGPQDVDGQTGVVAFNPNAHHMSNPILGNQSATVTDYKVPSHVVSWATESDSPFIADSAWCFVKALPLINEGYPPPGVQVILKIGPKPVTVQAYVRTTSPSGVVQHRVLLSDKDQITAYTLFSQLEMGGLKEYFLKPADFKPVPSPVTTKKTTIPADTSKHDIWRALLFKSPFPINEEMIAALKAVAEESTFEPAVFNCARQHEGFPQPAYGQVFTSQQIALVCLGYVTVTDTDKQNHRYMFAQNIDGKYTILTANMPMMAMYLPSESDEGFGNPDPWFTHPKPKTNKLIKQIYANGGNVKAVGATMSMFTKQWMKEAGLPAWAVITKNVVQDVASLFVPGAATKPVYEAVIGGLKARMKATHKGKGKVSKKMKTPVGSKPTATGVTQTTIASIPAWKPAVPPPKKIGKAKLPFNAPMILQQIENPEVGLFQNTGHVVSGGSNPNMVLITPGGFQWFFKIPKDKNPARIHAEVAAAKLGTLLDKPTTIPVGVLEFEGQTGSFQPLLEGSPPEADPNDLPDEDKGEVLAQHMIDMFMGDHDGFRGNWMRLKGGKLVPIDRGQAFKFVLKNMKESFDPNWHPSANVGEGYVKKLLKDWAKGAAQIPEIAWKAAREMIEKISQLKNVQIGSLLLPVFDAGGIPAAKRTKIVKTLGKRRDSYLKDWTKVLTKLQADFKWPKIGAVKLTARVHELKVDSKAMGFGKDQEKEIEVVKAQPLKGRAMKVDRDAIEQQEVMVKGCMWEVDPGKKVPATLIHFRVARPAGIKATSRLLKVSGGIKAVLGAGGSQPLAVDTQNDFWTKIRAAIGNINYHLSPPALGGMPNGPDGNLTEKYFVECFAIVPELQAILKATKATTGTYGPMDEPNPVVNSMAGMYLSYIDLYIKPIHANPTEYKGKHTPKLGQFIWDPPTGEEVPEESEVKGIPKPQGRNHAFWPKIVQMPEGLVVQSLQHDIHGGSSQNQFVIEKPKQYHLAINPPEMPSQVSGLYKGVKGHKAISWGIIVGEPSTATVAFLFKVFEKATAISMRPATKKDTEVLFWSRQAYLHQSGGHVQPKSDGTGVVTPEYKAAMEMYRQGKDDEALEHLQELAAAGVKMTVAQAKKAAKPLLAGIYDEEGVGFMRHERLGWTRAKLIKEFGKDWHIVHLLHTSVEKFVNDAKEYLSLMAHNIRPFAGVTGAEGSKGADYDAGGTQGVFANFRKGSTHQTRVFYFDHSLMLRTDVIVVYSGDGYGKDTYPRFTTPERWKADTLLSHGESKYTGDAGMGTSYQVNVRHGVDLLDYLDTAVCDSATERANVIAICKQRGWTAFGPLKRPPEKVFVVKGKEKW